MPLPKIDFIFHDSRLFANMDVRQRAILLSFEKMTKREIEAHCRQ